MYSSNDLAVEQQLVESGKTAPRLSPTAIDAVIQHEQYPVFPGTTLTVCALKLVDGYVVTGTSAAALAENFDAAISRRIARANARERVRELEGCLLRQRLHEGRPTGPRG